MDTSSHNHQTSSSLAAPANIVVATDLTDTDGLLPHVIAQAKSSGAHVTLVHALPVPDAVVLGQPCRELQEAGEAQARQEIAGMARRIEDEGIPCSIVLKRGVALDFVQHEIKERDATRLILGTHGHGYAGQKILGCVANDLLRAVHVPAFVIGPHATSASVHAVAHRILHPVSMTGRYRERAAFALELAHTDKADLTLLHVLDAGVLRGSYIREIFAKANHRLTELIPSQHAPIAVHTLVSCGDVPLEILRICSATESDWIVMGIERDCAWWSKSNNAAYQVIAQARCPVLVVRDRALAEQREYPFSTERTTAVESPGVLGRPVTS